MGRHLRTRFWLETGAAVALTLLAVITLVWRDWIEIVFHVDPDQHSGSLEWFIVMALAVLAAALSVMGRREWRRSGVAALESQT